jgi:serine/threonine-protein kinase
MTLLADGQAEAALKVYQPMIGKESNIDPLPALLFANDRRTDSDTALQQLAALEGTSNAYYVAWNFAYRNEREPAFEWLDRAYAQREGTLATDMTGDPALDKIANDPRYKALLRKMNLAE